MLLQYNSDKQNKKTLTEWYKRSKQRTTTLTHLYTCVYELLLQIVILTFYFFIFLSLQSTATNWCWYFFYIFFFFFWFLVISCLTVSLLIQFPSHKKKPNKVSPFIHQWHLHLKASPPPNLFPTFEPQAIIYSCIFFTFIILFFFYFLTKQTKRKLLFFC